MLFFHLMEGNTPKGFTLSNSKEKLGGLSNLLLLCCLKYKYWTEKLDSIETGNISREK